MQSVDMTVTTRKIFWVAMALGASTLGVSLLVVIDELFDLHHDLPLWVVFMALIPFFALQIVGAKRAFGYQTNIQGILSSVIAGSLLFIIGFLLSCFFQTFLGLYLDLWAKTPR